MTGAISMSASRPSRCEIGALSQKDEGSKRLMTVPGIGPIISSATVAAIGRGDVFSKGRDFGAWLGLVPGADVDRRSHRPREDIQARQPVSPNAVRAGSSRRSPDARRAGITTASSPGSRPQPQRLNRNMLAIALANKLARIAWRVLHHGRNFEVKGKCQSRCPNPRNGGPDMDSVPSCSMLSRPSLTVAAEERPALTTSARASLGILRSGPEKACGAGRTIEMMRDEREKRDEHARLRPISPPRSAREKGRDGATVFPAHSRTGDPNSPLEA